MGSCSSLKYKTYRELKSYHTGLYFALEALRTLDANSTTKETKELIDDYETQKVFVENRMAISEGRTMTTFWTCILLPELAEGVRERCLPTG